jgi:CubicO group peptidase (beta-lactamase class C family)
MRASPSQWYSRHTKKLSLRVLLLVLALVASAGAQQRGAARKLSPEKSEQLEKAAAHFLATTKTPGVSAAVVLNGATAWAAGLGMADLENSVPATSETLFRLASVSKPITAVALMELYERGQLDLDAEVQHYCPAFPKKEWPITTRQLLGHLGGIRHYDQDGQRDIPEDRAKHFASMAESLKIFAADDLVARPGSKFQYSTYGYTVLGCVLEGAASEKYAGFVRENVFHPAGMQHTQPDDLLAVIPHRSRWYHLDQSGAVQNAGVLDSSYKIPGGGFISSASDMARFEIAVLNGALLKNASRELMWTPQKTADGQTTHYGFGWGVVQKYGMTLYAHTGGQQGASTAILLAPDRRTGIVVLANMDGVDAAALSDEILRIVLDLQPATP